MELASQSVFSVQAGNTENHAGIVPSVLKQLTV